MALGVKTSFFASDGVHGSKGFVGYCQGLIHYLLNNFKQSSLSIQRSIQWYADADFGILFQRLALLRMGLFGLSTCKNTTCSPKKTPNSQLVR